MFPHVPFKWLQQKLRQVWWEEAEGISEKTGGSGCAEETGLEASHPASNGLTSLPARDLGDRVGTGVAGTPQ